MKSFLMIMLVLFLGCYDDTENEFLLVNPNSFTKTDNIDITLCRAYDKKTSIKIMMLGDSRTAWLDNNYIPYTTYNHSRGAISSIGGILRLDDIDTYDYNVFVLGLGTNDWSDERHSGFERRYEYIIQQVIAQNKANIIITLGITRSLGINIDNFNSMAAERNEIVKKLSEKYGCEYIDLNSILLNSDFDNDKLHFNPTGCQKIMDSIINVLN